MSFQSVCERLKLQLVEGWRSAWRWWSMRLHVIGTLIAGAILLVPQMPAEVQALIPIEWRAAAIALWFILGVVARVMQQSPRAGP